MSNFSLLGYNPFGFDLGLGTYMDCNKKVQKKSKFYF